MNVDAELWSLLRSYSEIRERGYELLKENGIAESDWEPTWIRFRAFIRQAKNYWSSAEHTPFQSSALLYYYSFLNLAKARVVMRDPSFPNRAYHGLSYNTDTQFTSLTGQCISVRKGREHIFPNYYLEVFGVEAPEELIVSNLFGYCQDVSVQYAHGGLGAPHSFPFIQRSLLDRKLERVWLIVAVPSQSSLSSFPKIFAKFHEVFAPIEDIQEANETLRDYFGFRSLEWVNFSFYEMREEFAYEIKDGIFLTAVREELVKAFHPWAAPFYYGGQFNGVVNIPFNDDSTVAIPMNDEVAIYAGMFFISELVRYRPDLLDRLLEERTGWLVESFVESCALKYLRAMVSRIVGRIFVFERH